MTDQEALAYIHAVSWTRRKPGLTRIRALLHALGDPQAGLRFVHIAGTNGKGSTAAMIAACCQAAGLRTGLFTSPFLLRFNERVQVDGQPIPDERLSQLVEQLKPVADALADTPTEFELICALGMLYFAQTQCQLVVLEVGLGGGLDPTNCIPTPEVAVLTALGLDHTAELGDTLAQIAQAKAGIIKPGGDVAYYGATPEADAVVAAACRAQGARLHPVEWAALQVTGQSPAGQQFTFGRLAGLQLPLLGAYQPKNAALAITALRLLQSRGWPITDADIRAGLAAVHWPGRFELLRAQPPFILDGSHNPQGMRATAESLQALWPGQRFVLVLSIMADKAAEEMLDAVCPLASAAYAVPAPSPRALPPARLAAMLQSRGVPATACDTVEQGLAAALAGGQPVCALGTLYFSGAVRQAFARLAAQPPAAE